MPHVFGDDKDAIHGRFLRFPHVGMRVIDCDGKKGTLEEPMCTYSATVNWDGLPYKNYINTACLFEILPSCPDRCDGQHHHEKCPKCGDVHRTQSHIPGRVMGGTWVKGASTTECRTCEHRFEYVPDKV